MPHLAWPVDNPRVYQAFGVNPERYKQFGLPGHEGIDFIAPRGTFVRAAADGEVFQAGYPPTNPYGLHIRIKHDTDGLTFRTIYAHLLSVNVSPGDPVNQGDLIALADNTGNSTGDHLHFGLEIDGAQTPGYRPGTVDPAPYLPSDPDRPATPEPHSALTVRVTNYLNLRSAPDVAAPIITVLAPDTILTLVGDVAAATALMTQQPQYVQVQTPAAQVGFVAVFYLRPT